MSARLFLAVAIFIALAGPSSAQVTPTSGDAAASAWRRAGDTATSPTIVARPTSNTPTLAPDPTPGQLHARVTRVTAGSGSLPNQHGQVWREYDITPYTARVATTKRPEQAIVDWILRETGYEAWHSEPLAVLSATPRTLRVYHTPAMQAVVADIVDRFVASEAETADLQPSGNHDRQPQLACPGPADAASGAVQTPGVNAWLLQRGRGGACCWPSCSAAATSTNTARRTCW